jgi:hypothetical protein
MQGQQWHIRSFNSTWDYALRKAPVFESRGTKERHYEGAIGIVSPDFPSIIIHVSDYLRKHADDSRLRVDGLRGPSQQTGGTSTYKLLSVSNTDYSTAKLAL